MARKKGTFETTGNFLVKMQEALDPRTVVEKKVDLINKDTWPSDGDTLYVYKGMIVGVASENSAYMLVDISKILNPDYSGWVKIGSTGGGGSYPDSEGGGGSIDPELLEGFIPLSRDFSDDFNNDFAR